MDPVTAALNFATEALTMAGKVWDATPAELKSQVAGDWAKFFHNISVVVINAQVQVNAALTKPAATT